MQHSIRYLVLGSWAILASLMATMLSLHSSAASSTFNVLFISIDDARNDLGVLGVGHARTPQMDAFASSARVFSHHYVQVPTCGASRCALLRGRYPDKSVHLNNNAIARTHTEWGGVHLPGWFRRHGYKTYALGKITHYPGGLMGKDWADGAEEITEAWDRSWIPDSPWKTPQAFMHGYANGVARTPGKSPAMERAEGDDFIHTDGWIARDAVATLEQLKTSEHPWFFAVGFFKPHLPFAAPARWYNLHQPGSIPSLSDVVARKPERSVTWHNSGEFRGNYGHAGRNPDHDTDYASELRHAYAACMSYVDEQIGHVLKALHATGQAENTVVVLWSDHGFLLGEHGIWGKHCLYEHALRSPLIVRVPGLAEPGVTTSAIVETVDIFPTLVDVCGLPKPEELDGLSLRPWLENPQLQTAKLGRSFWTGQQTLRTDRHRLIVRMSPKPGELDVELYDMIDDPDETKNLAQTSPGLLRQLRSQLRPHF